MNWSGWRYCLLEAQRDGDAEELEGAPLQRGRQRELLEGDASLGRQTDGVAGQGGEMRKQRMEAVAERPLRGLVRARLLLCRVSAPRLSHGRAEGAHAADR